MTTPEMSPLPQRIDAPPHEDKELRRRLNDKKTEYLRRFDIDLNNTSPEVMARAKDAMYKYRILHQVLYRGSARYDQAKKAVMEYVPGFDPDLFDNAWREIVVRVSGDTIQLRYSDESYDDILR